MSDRIQLNSAMHPIEVREPMPVFRLLAAAADKQSRTDIKRQQVEAGSFDNCDAIDDVTSHRVLKALDEITGCNVSGKGGGEGNGFDYIDPAPCR